LTQLESALLRRSEQDRDKILRMTSIEKDKHANEEESAVGSSRIYQNDQQNDYENDNVAINRKPIQSANSYSTIKKDYNNNQKLNQRSGQHDQQKLHVNDLRIKNKQNNVNETSFMTITNTSFFHNNQNHDQNVNTHRVNNIHRSNSTTTNNRRRADFDEENNINININSKSLILSPRRTTNNNINNNINKKNNQNNSTLISDTITSLQDSLQNEAAFNQDENDHDYYKTDDDSTVVEPYSYPLNKIRGDKYEKYVIINEK
jgi:hypothetical protein